jgi:hypothetical protein
MSEVTVSTTFDNAFKNIVADVGDSTTPSDEIDGEEYFENPNGVEFGHWVANEYAGKVFEGIVCGENPHYDKKWDDAKLEIKGIRASSKKEATSCTTSTPTKNTFNSRALKAIDGDFSHGMDKTGKRQVLSNTSFQQTNPSEFDVFIGFVFFLDRVRVYVIPSENIAHTIGEASDRIKLVPQHRNPKEGHLLLRNIHAKPEKFVMFELIHNNDISLRNLGDYL